MCACLQEATAAGAAAASTAAAALLAGGGRDEGGRGEGSQPPLSTRPSRTDANPSLNPTASHGDAAPHLAVQLNRLSMAQVRALTPPHASPSLPPLSPQLPPSHSLIPASSHLRCCQEGGPFALRVRFAPTAPLTWPCWCLASTVQNRKAPFARFVALQVLRIATDVAAGLAYLHKRPAVVSLPPHPTVMLEDTASGSSTAGERGTLNFCRRRECNVSGN